ncbi:MAG: hypothetical protein H6926_00675 [Chromatiales bacterium]|nr:hypothetical protein [Gammaproteobacteria bacterium]MCP5351693.1 hypothetical protein [Chromatiales bacterium]
MNNDRRYMGIHNDPRGAMNATGNIIRDAWVFGLLPETETCEGWLPGGISDLYEKVSKAWEPFAGIPSRLPPELFEKHQRIYAAAVERARAKGWDPDQEIEDEG